jgi:hypothetical protein
MSSSGWSMHWLSWSIFGYEHKIFYSLDKWDQILVKGWLTTWGNVKKYILASPSKWVVGLVLRGGVPRGIAPVLYMQVQHLHVHTN